MAHLTRTSVGRESKGPMNWQYNRKDTWAADDDVTDADLKQLKAEHYSMFPVISVKFDVQTDNRTVIATVIKDNCQ